MFKRFKFAILILFICVLCAGCAAIGTRSYIWGSENLLFAINLEKCKHYSSPTRLIKGGSTKTIVVGKRNNACLIRDIYNGGFGNPPLVHDYTLTSEVSKEISEMLKTALGEPLYQEEKAKELAKQFIKKYGLWCVDNNKFHELGYCIEEYLSTPMFEPKNEAKLKIYNQKKNKELAQCNNRKRIIIDRIQNTPNYYRMSEKAKEAVLCRDMNNNGYNCSIHNNYKTTKKIGSLSKRTEVSQCLLEFDLNGKINTNHFYYKSLNDILEEK